MSGEASELIAVRDLRVGHFVFIDLGWLAHPFPLNAFKIRTQSQIDTIRGLGLQQIRISPEKSDPLVDPVGEASSPKPPPENPNEEARRARAQALAEQKTRLQHCDREFSAAANVYDQVAQTFRAEPEQARQHSEMLVDGLLVHLQGREEVSIRLLSEQVGDAAPLHSINVAVVSLLLGRAMEVDAPALRDLGIGALLHDIGKIALPLAVRRHSDQFSAADLARYQEHVSQGLDDGRHMGLSANVLQVIGQHHERADGSGFPRGLGNASLLLGSRIVALVNAYDNLCNPDNPSGGMTPHEALSFLFVQKKAQFDGIVLGAFIRMMGIYPPGSVVQLTDDRFALVVSGNSSRPLKPQVVIHQAEIPAEEALIVDLEQVPELGVRRSLRPLQLPRPVLDYLSPRQRICYFFERARTLDRATDDAVDVA